MGPNNVITMSAGERDAAFREATRTLAVDLVTAEVMTALTRAAVEAVLLKGPSVARWLYPRGVGRVYVDTDILVSPERQALAEHVLTTLGFADPLAEGTADEHDPTATPWRRARDRAVVDLHRSLRGVRVPADDAWAVLSAQTEQMTIAGVGVKVLKAPARALNLALHAAHDGIRNSQCLEDLRRALDQLPTSTWSQAGQLARRLDAQSAFAAGLRLLANGRALADRLGLPRVQSVQVCLRATTPPPLALGLAALHAIPGWRGRLRFILRNALPTPAFMRFLTPIARHGPFGLVAAYAWRWILFLWRIVPAYRAWRRAQQEVQFDRTD